MGFDRRSVFESITCLVCWIPISFLIDSPSNYNIADLHRNLFIFVVPFLVQFLLVSIDEKKSQIIKKTNGILAILVFISLTPVLNYFLIDSKNILLIGFGKMSYEIPKKILIYSYVFLAGAPFLNCFIETKGGENK